jgi:pimeloyl-ACP methyl ester carboxylesterase
MKRILVTALLVVLGFAVLAAGATAAVLFRPDLSWQELDARYAGAEPRWVDLSPELRVRVRVSGPMATQSPRTPLVLVHGYTASLETWEPWAMRLARDRVVIRLDLPGHGLTRTPDGQDVGLPALVDVVDRTTRALGVEWFAIGGNSMGGHVAWRFAVAHPDRVTALIPVSTAGVPGDTPAAATAQDESVDGFALVRNPITRPLVRWMGSRGLIEQGLKVAFHDDAQVTPDMVDRYWAMLRAPGARDVIQRIPFAQEPDPAAIAALSTLRVPTLVLHGREDRVIPVASGEAIARRIPGARLIIYDAIGHIPMEEAAARSAEDVAGFLASVDVRMAELTGSAPTPAPGAP